MRHKCDIQRGAGVPGFAFPRTGIFGMGECGNTTLLLITPNIFIYKKNIIYLTIFETCNVFKKVKIH